jgi:hypothetical protein
MAALKRRMYCLGDTIVGSLPACDARRDMTRSACGVCASPMCAFAEQQHMPGLARRAWRRRPALPRAAPRHATCPPTRTRTRTCAAEDAAGLDPRLQLLVPGVGADEVDEPHHQLVGLAVDACTRST